MPSADNKSVKNRLCPLGVINISKIEKCDWPESIAIKCCGLPRQNWSHSEGAMFSAKKQLVSVYNHNVLLNFRLKRCNSLAYLINIIMFLIACSFMRVWQTQRIMHIHNSLLIATVSRQKRNTYQKVIQLPYWNSISVSQNVKTDKMRSH